jgi:hypothetical protein
LCKIRRIVCIRQPGRRASAQSERGAAGSEPNPLETRLLEAAGAGLPSRRILE